MPRSTRVRTLSADYWPGFVDALATLLLVFIFLLSVFVLTQQFLGSQLFERDAAVVRLEQEIASLSQALGLAQTEKAAIESNLERLQATLLAQTDRAARAVSEQDRLTAMLEALQKERDAQGDELSTVQQSLSEQEKISLEARAQVALLNEQIAALRLQLRGLEEALDVADAKDKEQEVVIEDLGRRLNVALAQKVQELSDVRSDFLAALKRVLGDRQDIQIVGDRFVIQSEVLFDSASADVNDQGFVELRKVADVIKEIGSSVPPGVSWLIRVDGHSDVIPIRNDVFASNWALSQARALAVVNFLVAQGVPPQRLAAAGFGEFQPLERGRSEPILRRNRRIEFKVTDR